MPTSGHRVGAHAGVAEQRRSFRHLGEEGDAEVRIHHLHQGQQTGRGKAAHRLDIAQATGRQRLVPKAVSVLQQQYAPGVQAVQAHPLRIDQGGPLAAGEPEGVPEQNHRLGAAKLVGKREEKEVEAAGHEIGMDARARVLVQV